MTTKEPTGDEPWVTPLLIFAKKIKVSPPTVYKEINRGKLDTIMIGRRRYVTNRQRDEYLAAKEAEAKTHKGVFPGRKTGERPLITSDDPEGYISRKASEGQ